MTEEEWLFRLRSHGGVLTSVLQSPLGWMKLRQNDPDDKFTAKDLPHRIDPIPHQFVAQNEPAKGINYDNAVPSVVDISNARRPKYSVNNVGYWNESVSGGAAGAVNLDLLTFDAVLSNCSLGGIRREAGKLWINANGTFTERVAIYNDALTKFRLCLLETRHYRPWRALNNTIRTLWANTDDFFTRVTDYSDIILTVFLSWHQYDDVNPWNWSSLTDASNLLLQNYFEWAGTEPLCRWIRTEGFTKAHWDAVYGRQCNTNMSKTVTPQSLEVVYLYARPINKLHYWPNDGLSYPATYYRNVPPYVVYVHIAQDAIVSPAGDIWTNWLKLVPYACSQETDPRPPMLYQLLPIYGEVFVVTQFWGSAYFHKMIEGIPRLAPYLSFLQRNQDIRIHMPDQNSHTEIIFKILGLNKERIITGDVRAKVVYLPQATPCGFAQTPAIQILAQKYRSYVESTQPNITRNSVVMVKRTQGRRLKHHDLILAAIATLSAEFHFEFVLFDDAQVPTFEKTMSIFYSARVIIGPHGAGLSNMIFAQPGTYIIEGVCNEPHSNMCFQHTAHVLGHHYHGIPSSEGCEDYIDIQPAVVKDVLRTYLKHMTENTATSVPVT